MDKVKTPTQNLFNARIVKTRFDLWPLMGVISFGCFMGLAFSVYSMVQKSDVRLKKSSGIAPWEEIDPEKPQKLMTVNLKYKKIPEVEQLRREIGSYQLK